MTLLEFSKKYGIKINFNKNTKEISMPDIMGEGNRWKLWKLSDYLVYSVTGGSIFFVKV